MRELINRQNTSEFRNTRYGLLGNIAANGCGAIAAYNVLNANGVDVSLDEVVKKLRIRLGMAFGLGKFGTNILSLAALLASCFTLRIRFIILNNGKSAANCDSLIIMYYWFKSKRIGAHYVAGVKSEDGYFDFYNYSLFPQHLKIEDFISRMKRQHEYPLWLIGITKKRGKKK